MPTFTYRSSSYLFYGEHGRGEECAVFALVEDQKLDVYVSGWGRTSAESCTTDENGPVRNLKCKLPFQVCKVFPAIFPNIIAIKLLLSTFKYVNLKEESMYSHENPFTFSKTIFFV